jgi:general secretion pathway protein K
VRRSRVRGQRADQRGVALIMVTWVLMVLGVLALDFSQFMRDDAMAGINFAEEAQGYYLALGGMNHALLEAVQGREQELGRVANRGGVPSGDEADQPKPQPVDGEWHSGEFAGGKFSVRLTDEGGKIPINKTSASVLRALLRSVVQGGSRVKGVGRREEAELNVIVDSILDWRDTDNETRPEGAEKAYYAQLPTPYRPKNGFFDSPEELLLVRGVTADLLYGTPEQPGLRDVISVYSKTGSINVRTISAATLQMLFAVDPETAMGLRDQCKGDPEGCLAILQGQASTIDERLQSMFVDEDPHLLFVEARADEKQDRNRSSVAAVVEISGDDVDGAAG